MEKVTRTDCVRSEYIKKSQREEEYPMKNKQKEV